MDTKWNNMDNGPGTELDYYAAPLDKTTGTPLREGKPRSPGRVKPWVSFLCFFLGMTLVLSSVGETVSRIVWERDPFPRFTSDWQETDAFHLEVSDYLRDFLTIGVGGELDFYTSSYWMEDERYVTSGAGGGTAIVEENPGILEFFLITKPHEVEQQTTDWGYAQSSSRPAEPYRERAPDADYQTDKNILYSIFADKTEDREEKSYTNSDKFWTEWIKDPAYNFFLTFQNGKVTIRKDGVDLDVYGSGIYNSDSQWFVPGYSNFPVSEQLDGIEVHMAIRKDPICYYGVDYQAGNTYYSSGLYYIARQVELSRAFYQTQAVLLACGVVLLFVWFVLRKVRFAADRKIASWTVHIWTEARVLIGFVLLWTLVFETNWLSELYYSLRDGWYAWDSGYTLSETGAQILAAALYNVPGLLTLFWLCWLLRNDHRYNPKEARRSLLRPFFRSLRARDLKRPLEKRVSRMEGISAFAVLFLEMEVIFFLVLHSVFYYNPLPSWSLWTLFLLPVLVAAAITVYHVRRQCQIAEDIGRLADQVESVRAGDLSKPLILPEDADLRRTADSLNDIQAGMKAALEEQTRSERMKVELVSNVSHDLKTPLTSILSYAELLRQEDLPPAAADYARIIDEKAQRLKTMVQDVFEVSKAAADQLPVRLERLDLGKLLRQTLADMDGPIQASALTFKVDVPESPVMITADGKRLYRVFQNLIDNALRYALEGSRVYLSLKTAGGNAEASMRNTSRSELPEGVDFTARFVRGDASRTDGGSGLGLSIASSFTEACGGEFRVETVADLFTAIVTFPLAEGE